MRYLMGAQTQSLNTEVVLHFKIHHFVVAKFGNRF